MYYICNVKLKQPIMSKTKNLMRFNNIVLFRDSQLTDDWKAPWDDAWDIEVNNDKARVYPINNPWSNGKPSRFNKLKLIRKVDNSNKRVYQLIVNGNKAYFSIAHIIS